MNHIEKEEFGSPIPVTRRIIEIIESKPNLSIRTLALKLKSVNRETLRQSLHGHRYLSPKEMEDIANALNISIERLQQTDLVDLVKEIRACLKWKTDMPRTVVICKLYLKAALGWSEKCDALNFLAHACFEQGDYEESHKLWLEAFELAKKIAEKFKKTDRLYGILNNLMVSYTARKEYSNLGETIALVEDVFKFDHEKMGAIYHSKAMIAEQFRNAEKTEEYLYKSLNELVCSGIEIKIGRALVNVGYFEFKSYNYRKAKGLLENAIEKLEGDTYTLPIAIKEYAKALLKLGENGSAGQIIEDNYALAADRPDLQAKYDLLLAIAKNEPNYAQNIVLNGSVGRSVRALACRMLINHYNAIGDSTAVVQYYKMEERILENTDLLHKEDF